MAETIENNVRRLIIDEQPINPKYYEKMSELLDALIEQRKKETLAYQEYRAKIVELTKKVKNPTAGQAYPAGLNTPAKRALYDNLGKDEALALEVDSAVRASRQDDWRSNPIKIKKVRLRSRTRYGRRESKPPIQARRRVLALRGRSRARGLETRSMISSTDRKSVV